MDRSEHARVLGMNQEPRDSIVMKDGSLRGERLEGGGVHLSRHRQGTPLAGVIEEVGQDLVHERLSRADLHDLADASGVEVIQVPAQQLPRAVAHGDALEQAPAPPVGQQIQEPIQGPPVVLRPQGSIDRQAGQTLQQIVGRQVLPSRSGPGQPDRLSQDERRERVRRGAKRSAHPGRGGRQAAPLQDRQEVAARA